MTAALTLVVGVVAACGDDPQPEPSPTPTSSSGATSTSPSETSTSAQPPVSPAAGPVLDMPSARVRAPEGYRMQNNPSFQASAADGETTNMIRLSEIGTDQALTLRELAQITLDTSSYLRKPKILAPTTLDGVQVYHLSGPVDSSSTVERYGAIYGTSIVSLELNLETRIPAPERQELVESVLASFEWK